MLTYPRFTAGPFTNFGRIIAFQSTAESEYDGLTLELNRRFARHASARIAYTLGKVTDTVPEATAVVPGSSIDDAKYGSNPKNFEIDRTVGNNDQRHRFVFSGIYDPNGVMTGKSGIGAALARGWNFSAIYTAASGPTADDRRSADHAGRHQSDLLNALRSQPSRSRSITPGCWC